ncbi:MAG: YdhR family protein, partial [Desulfocapsaceae bacterium]
EARTIFLSTAPKYQDVPGLIRKVYIFSEDENTVGGIYLWNSRAEAEAMYTESWKAFVQEKYGTDPSVTYFESPVVVDNVTHDILSDE